jgi:hypothetical protein
MNRRTALKTAVAAVAAICLPMEAPAQDELITLWVKNPETGKFEQLDFDAKDKYDWMVAKP